MLTDKSRPAPFLVCTYSFGEDELPTVRAAFDMDQATVLAQMEANASCQPVVRIYAIDEVCRLVTSLRM